MCEPCYGPIPSAYNKMHTALHDQMKQVCTNLVCFLFLPTKKVTNHCMSFIGLFFAQLPTAQVSKRKKVNKT